jgi:hypothetical protein
VNPSSLLRRALCAPVIATLAACGAVQLPNAPPLRSAAERRPVAGTLIYAAGDIASYVFTFPKGRLVGTISSPAFGACSDQSGDVYFTQVRDIAEYRHGGTKPIATLKVPGTAYSCSVDPVSGNLAAVVFCIKHCGEEVFVFTAGGKRPRRYPIPMLTSLLYCTYDAGGNLFVDGYDGTRFGLAELASGSAGFSSITLKNSIKYPAQIQWDGKDLAIETRENPVILRVAVSGSSARVVGRVHLNGVGGRATQSWIAGGRIAVPTGPNLKRAIEIMFWRYPAGGNPTNVFNGFIGSGHAMIDAVTFSPP